MSRPLLQLIRAWPTLPRTLAKPNPRARNIFVLAFLLSVLLYTLFYQQTFALGDSQKLSDARAKLQSIFPWTAGRVEHPIPSLMQEAKTRFESMMNKQSTSLSEASHEYRRRYRRDPPKGFDEWYAFAVANKVKIIDEYDGMEADLKPFRAMTGKRFRDRVIHTIKLPNVYNLTLTKGRIVTREHDFHGYIKRFVSKLPDMSIALNDQDEPKVLVPWEYTHENSQEDSDLEAMAKSTFSDAWDGRGSTWEAFRQTCHPLSPARQASAEGLTISGALEADQSDDLLLEGDRQMLGFRKRPDDGVDFCEHPSRRFQHGHFSSRWRTIPALVPLLSPGKAPGYSDILIPSNYYITNWPQYLYGDDHDGIISDFDSNEKPWHQKQNMMYWRGSTTGGWNLFPGSFDRFHRQRLVQMTFRESLANHTVIFPLTPSGSEYAVRDIPASRLNLEIVDSAFTKAVECDDVKPDGCDTIRKTLHFAEEQPFNTHWKYKYVIDVDGMSYSARFIAFLKSESTPIKATVYREFYSDWVQPWLHYIPLSSDYGELYSIYAYFSGATSSMQDSVKDPKTPASWLSNFVITSPKGAEGDAQLRAIGHAGGSGN